MRKRLVSGILLVAMVAAAAGAKKLPKPGWNLFSKEQDVQLGQEAAQQIEKQYQVVSNAELTAYVNRIGNRLVKQGGIEGFPYTFKVVNDDSINAFALPGGPMYVHTGLMKAAENEAQLAGVLAHELSHVYLRHGTNQASKANGLQIIAMLGGQLAGGGMLGSLANLGIGLGANSVLMKFSRGAESDADLMGMNIMARSGYNPIEMARFFEKLEAESGKSSKMQEFFSSHPNPGNRVKMVEEQMRYLPSKQYGAQEGNLQQMQQIIGKLPAAPKPGTQQQQQQGPAPTTDKMPSIQLSGRTQTYQNNALQFEYPEGWQQVSSEQNSVTIAPKEGIVQGQDGQTAFGYAIVAGAAQPPSGKVDLNKDTQAFLQNLVQSNPGSKVASNPSQVSISSSPALVTQVQGTSPFRGQKENVVVITVDRQNALYYFIFVSPETDYKRLEPVYQRVAQSIRINR